MAKGFDCATPLNTNKCLEFIAQGFSFVCRYLAPAGSWKRLTAAEAYSITNAGLWLISVFEHSADNALLGAAQGAEDGRLALQYAEEVGQPKGSVIYAAVDVDVNTSHYDAIEAYLRAFDAKIGGYELGVYGEHEVCEAMRERDVVEKVWQTYAWSRGVVVENPNVYQFENDITINGIGIDRDESNGDAGGWKVGMAIERSNTLSAGVANTIINTWISESWKETEKARRDVETIGDAAASAKLEEQKQYYNWLANELRKAAGLPLEYGGDL